MPCYKPLHGYLSRTPNSSGKRSVVFDYRKGYIDLRVDVPCGRCIGCRLERSRQWAMRCVHESQLYDDNCFITLTYDDDHLPVGGSLVKADFQKFMKRLRKRFGSGVRYYHCGEYGDQTNRPHHHACLFNFDFDDKKLLTIAGRSSDAPPIFTSDVLSQLWTFGLHTIGNVTFESASYVARYIMKKINGDMADKHYNGRIPEYTTMSRRPGIGFDWYKKFKCDVFPNDEVILRGGVVSKPPRYYDNLCMEEDPKLMAILKGRRARSSRDNPNNRDDRLAQREVSEVARLKLFNNRSI